MEWVETESLWLDCPGVADEFVGCLAVQRFEPASEVVGRHEVTEMAAELVVVVVMISVNRGFLNGPVHAFDLAVGPRMFGFGEAVIDVGFGTGELESMSAER